MKIIYFFGFILFLTNCTGSRVTKVKQNSEEAHWILAYKTTVFMSCMDTPEQNNQDISRAICFDIIGDANYFNHADSIGKLFHNSIRPSPIRDFEGRKPVTIQCLDYYKSRELDSIARSEYKRYQKELLNHH